MNKFLLLTIIPIIFILTSPKLHAQSLGINTDGSVPNTSAMLDVKNPNKGMLIPRVALTGTTDAATITSPATSLLVYNTTAAGSGVTAVKPGFYYWNGSAWIIFSTSSSAWSLTGNAGTVDGTSFIGTTDNVPLNIRVGNQKAGRIELSVPGNTFWGFQAGNSNTSGQLNTGNGYGALYSNTSGNYNTANGFGALATNTSGNNNTANGYAALNLNTGGYSNTANGFSALYLNTTGYRNTATGDSALYSNQTGEGNTANGYLALYSNTANDNTANGYQALYLNTSGSFNTADGYQALHINTSGSFNTADGYSALSSNTGNRNTATGANALSSNTGDDNTAFGESALSSNTTGLYNTALGEGALGTNTTGNSNTALGYGADVSSNNLVNATALGNDAIVNASNKIRLGDNSVTVIEGHVGFSVASDKRFKYNIKDNVPGLAFIKKLTPVTYYFDEAQLDEYTKTGILRQSRLLSRQDDIAFHASYTGEKQLHTGFLAQDVEKIAKDLGYEFDGVHAPANDKDHYSLAYSQFIMPLVKAVQEQQQIIEKQNSDIEILKAQVAALTKTVNTLTHK